MVSSLSNALGGMLRVLFSLESEKEMIPLLRLSQTHSQCISMPSLASDKKKDAWQLGALGFSRQVILMIVSYREGKNAPTVPDPGSGMIQF